MPVEPENGTAPVTPKLPADVPARGDARPGTVYWVTGLSGAGKTTIGRLLRDRLEAGKRSVVHLDGDDMRRALCSDLGHTVEDRLVSAMRYAAICKLLSTQGIDVVCGTISLFHECRDWCRRNIPNYRVVYLRVPLDVLVKRDVKNIYARALKGELDNVVGIDITAEFPSDPELVIDNDGSVAPAKLVDQIVDQLSGAN